MKKLMLLALALWFGVGIAQAKEAAELAEDPVIEKRLMILSEELRCLVCQNETLAASRADLAEDLRREIRQKMREGLSDKEIVDYLVERYGDFVLYNPAVKPKTAMLWFGPFVLMAGGVLFLIYYLKRRRTRIVEQPLSEEEHRKASALLNEGENK
ncbi:MAG: cytochrome c-type biogenesis protein [Pseudomonadota bacterium]